MRDYHNCPVLKRLSCRTITEDISLPEDLQRWVTHQTIPVHTVTRRVIVPPTPLPDYQILAIVGRSGSGKTTLLKQLNHCGTKHFPNKMYEAGTAIVSNFSNRQDAIERLSAVGLKSIPVWVKPREVLSVGEGFRADMALNINDDTMFDEFTSTVDRNVARSCCTSLGRYIRRSGKKGIIVCSCHKDFIEYLKPDIVIDTDDMCVYDLRDTDLSVDTQIDIYRTNDKSLWDMFKEHHYMSSSLNKACHFYIMKLHSTGEIVGCFSTLPQMTGTAKWRWRVHRTVVLPDYQGLGISSRTLNFFGDYYQSLGRFLSIRTSSIPMLNSLRKNPTWIVGQTTNSYLVDQKKTHWTSFGDTLKNSIRNKDCTSANYAGKRYGKSIMTIRVTHPENIESNYIDNIEKIVESNPDKDIILCWGRVGHFIENDQLHQIIAQYKLRHRFDQTLYGKYIRQLGTVITV